MHAPGYFVKGPKYFVERPKYFVKENIMFITNRPDGEICLKYPIK